MKFVLITQSQAMADVAKEAFTRDDLEIYGDWKEALEASHDADMIFVDLIATLKEPGKIQGYEEFADAKRAHPKASVVPLVLISPPENYKIDFITAWPNFLAMNIQQPVNRQKFKMAAAIL